jgi:hypothetical protein
MHKPQIMIVLVGCLLAGLVILLGVSFYGALLPDGERRRVNETISHSGGTTGTLHETSVAVFDPSDFSTVQGDSSLKTAKVFSTW